MASPQAYFSFHFARSPSVDVASRLHLIVPLADSALESASHNQTNSPGSKYPQEAKAYAPKAARAFTFVRFNQTTHSTNRLEEQMETTAPSGNGISNGLGNTVNKASSSAHSLVDSLAKSAQDTADGAKPAIAKAAGEAHLVLGKAAGAAGQAADFISDQAESLNAKQKQFMEDASKLVADHPMKSLAIAAGVGYLICRIMR